MLRTFIQVTALALTIESAWFLARGNLSLSPAAIAELSKPKWGYNLDVARNIAQQYADTRVGTWLLVIAFVLQSAHLLWPVRWDDFAVNRTGVIAGVVVALLAYEGSTRLASRIQAQQFKEVEQLLKPENDATRTPTS